MGYEKQQWNTTSYVNPTRMNHIEEGIESNSEEIGVLKQNKVDQNSVANLSSIELFSNTPFIDFHFHTSPQDYSARVVNDGENHLTMPNCAIPNIDKLDTINGVETDKCLVEDKNAYMRLDGSHLAIDTVADLNNFGFGIGLFSPNAMNLPATDWWMVISANAGGTAVQIAIALASGSIFQRYCAASNWSGWTLKLA